MSAPPGIPLYTAEAVRAADRCAQERHGIPGTLLMERAGAGALAAALARFGAAARGRVVVVAGPGHNGGDGLVLARHARRLGARVTVVRVASRPPAGDAAWALARARAAGVPVEEPAAGELPSRLRALLAEADLAVDALLGTGARGAPRGPLARAVEELRGWRARTGRPLLALDLPSGLDPDRGLPTEPCVQADLTATFGALKQGLVAGPALAWVGALQLVPLGLPRDCLPPPAAHLLDPQAAAARVPPVAVDAHKGRRGRVWVVGGARGMVGAAVLAARGALRGGAGLVHVAVPAGERPAVAAAVPEALTLGLPEADGAPAAEAWAALRSALAAADAVVMGPGLGRGPGAVHLARAAWAELVRPGVWDADALNALAAGDPGPPGGPRVLTPHPGEAARLLGATVDDVQADRLAAARALARRYGAVAVLKGPRTVVADPGGAAWVIPTGSPALATGGTGDVLAGLAGALLARGAPPLDAALAAAFLHGLAGQWLEERYGRWGATAADLPAALPEAGRALAAAVAAGPAACARLLARCGVLVPA